MGEAMSWEAQGSVSPLFMEQLSSQPAHGEQKNRLRTSVKESLAEVDRNRWFERLNTNCRQFKADL